jgi:hypothetical protein
MLLSFSKPHPVLKMAYILLPPDLLQLLVLSSINIETHGLHDGLFGIYRDRTDGPSEWEIWRGVRRVVEGTRTGTATLMRRILARETNINSSAEDGFAWYKFPHLRRSINVPDERYMHAMVGCMVGGPRLVSSYFITIFLPIFLSLYPPRFLDVSLSTASRVALTFDTRVSLHERWYYNWWLNFTR